MKTLLLLLTHIALSRAVGWDEFTELDEYVRSSEDVYGYYVINIQKVPGATIHVLNMTSLKWFDETLTTTPIWWHYQVVIIPDQLTYTDAALLYIYNGEMDDDIPTNETDIVQYLISFSINTGAVTSLLKQIPNQPLYFVDEKNGTRPRVEDAIVGYTWKLFIEETVTDSSVILLFPMVKAAKQAVDTLIDYVKSVNPEIQIKEIMPSGFSKRGWTTWLLACVDQRVFAMAPTVFDQLNFYEGIQGHYKSLGGWSWSFLPYWNTEVTDYLHHPRAQIINKHIDPLEYNERLTMPKHLHGATGDEFFLPDGTHYWFSNITGEIHYTIFENDNHGLDDHREPLWENIENLFVSVKENIPRPQYTFTRSINDYERTGTIRLTTTTIPDYVKVWYADTTNRTCEPNDQITGTCRRDFRLDRFDLPTDTLIYHWEDSPTFLGDGVYEASYSFRSDFGYRIMHMEAGYPGAGDRQMRVTSETNILPDVHPFPICLTPDECHGVLK